MIFLSCWGKFSWGKKQKPSDWAEVTLCLIISSSWVERENDFCVQGRVAGERAVHTERIFIFNSGAVSQMGNMPHKIVSRLCLNTECFYYLVWLLPLPMFRRRMKKEKKIELIFLISAKPKYILKGKNRESYCQLIYNHSCSQYLEKACLLLPWIF